MSDRPSTEDMILSLRDARLFFIERGLRDAIAGRLEELSAPGKRTIESPAEYVRRLNEENLALAEKVKALEAEVGEVARARRKAGSDAGGVVRRGSDGGVRAPQAGAGRRNSGDTCVAPT